jgi:hypothetical protein
MRGALLVTFRCATLLSARGALMYNHFGQQAFRKHIKKQMVGCLSPKLRTRSSSGTALLWGDGLAGVRL